VVMEPIRDQNPATGFIEGIHGIVKETGAVLVIDEVSAGFRLNTGGAHLLYKFEPDIAVFAKAMSNGYPMAAIIGKGRVMDAAQRTFISSTYWTDRIGPVAALATIRKHRRLDVARHLVAIGKRVQEGWREAADQAGLSIDIGGIPPLSHFNLVGNDAQAKHTLFTQLMLERGFLAGKAFYSTYAHQNEHVEIYLDAVKDVFGIITGAVKHGDVQAMLKGPIAHSSFRRLA